MMCAFLAVGGFYMITTFAISYGTGIGLDRGLMVNATLIASVAQIFVTVIAGKLAVRWGSAFMVLLGGATTALAAFPIFWLIDQQSPAAVVVAIVLGIVLMTVGYAGTGSALADLFPAALRYSGVSLGYNIAGALSGFMPFLSLAALEAAGNQSWAPALVLVGIAAITALGGAIAGRLRPLD
nr:hypothetical protein [Agromyces mediolanus]